MIALKELIKVAAALVVGISILAVPDSSAAQEQVAERCVGKRVLRCISVDREGRYYGPVASIMDAHGRPNYRVLARDVHVQRWSPADRRWVLVKGAGGADRDGFHDVSDYAPGRFFVPRCGQTYRARAWFRWIDGPDPGGQWLTSRTFKRC